MRCNVKNIEGYSIIQNIT